MWPDSPDRDTPIKDWNVMPPHVVCCCDLGVGSTFFLTEELVVLCSWSVCVLITCVNLTCSECLCCWQNMYDKIWYMKCDAFFQSFMYSQVVRFWSLVLKYETMCCQSNYVLRTWDWSTIPVWSIQFFSYFYRQFSVHWTCRLNLYIRTEPELVWAGVFKCMDWTWELQPETETKCINWTCIFEPETDTKSCLKIPDCKGLKKPYVLYTEDCALVESWETKWSVL
jgi:hypothetical protein